MKRVWKCIIAAVCITAVSAAVYAQPQPLKPGQDPYWKLQSFRHGPNYFKVLNLKETTPLVEGEWDFKHYHTYSEILYWFKRWAQDYPKLVSVYVGGVSYEGRDIMQVTLTNKATGPDTDKPAMMLDANRHSGEVTAAESAFWMLHYMLVNYGTDPEITRLVDTYAFYFRPKNNPDGSDLYLNTAQTLRSTVHPYDQDGDGLLDEDPADDIDGDGFIRQIRIKMPKGQGTMIADPRDPKGRLMITAPAGEGIYRVMTESLDNDGDGRIDEDGIGGLDLHRNYVENWRPMPGRDATDRGWTQGGAGDYPLSEPETRSLVVFLLEHPNVAVANSMDTTVPMHLRPPSTSASDERMYPEDLALYKYFDQKGKEITGYERAGDVFNDYSGGRGSPLFGHGPDFGYFYYGAIWYGDELWNGGRVGDYNKDGREDDLDRLLFNDKELQVSRFKPWTKGQHPVYGEVEFGGWNGKFWSQNPPPELLEEWASKEARFNLMLASHMPNVVINEPAVTKSAENEYTIDIVIENKGYMPTALKQAQLVKIVRPDMVYLDFPEGTLGRGGGGRGGRGGGAVGGGRGGGAVGGGRAGAAGGAAAGAQPQQARVTMVSPTQPSIDIDRLSGGEKKTVTFKVRLNDTARLTATIRYSSTRGGVHRKEFAIGGQPQ